MRFIFLAGSAVISASALAQTGSFDHLRPFSWADEPVKVFADGRCNDKLPQTYLDIEGLDCWYPVWKGKSNFYLKVKVFASRQSLPRAVTGKDAGYTVPRDVWVMGSHQSDGSVRYRKSMSIYRVSCSESVVKFALLRQIGYDASDNIVQDVDYKMAQLKAALPGSREEKIAEAACNR